CSASGVIPIGQPMRRAWKKQFSGGATLQPARARPDRPSVPAIAIRRVIPCTFRCSTRLCLPRSHVHSLGFFSAIARGERTLVAPKTASLENFRPYTANCHYSLRWAPHFGGFL